MRPLLRGGRRRPPRPAHARDGHAARRFPARRVLDLLGDGLRRTSCGSSRRRASRSSVRSAARATRSSSSAATARASTRRRSRAWVDVFAMGDGEKLVPAIAEILRRDLDARRDARRPRGRQGPLRARGPRRARRGRRRRGRSSSSSSRAAEGALREPPHTTILTPHTELSDKLLIEIARGCSEMCRFCWAAYAMAPQVRVSAENVLEVARRNRPLTGRVGLIATAVADHPEILPILRGLAGASITTSPFRP